MNHHINAANEQLSRKISVLGVECKDGCNQMATTAETQLMIATNLRVENNTLQRQTKMPYFNGKLHASLKMWRKSNHTRDVTRAAKLHLLALALLGHAVSCPGVLGPKGTWLHCRLKYIQGGGDWCHVKLAVVNLAVGNLAEAPGFRVVNLADTARRVVMCRALQAWQSLATTATHNAGETHLPHSPSDEGQIDLRS